MIAVPHVVVVYAAVAKQRRSGGGREVWSRGVEGRGGKGGSESCIM